MTPLHLTLGRLYPVSVLKSLVMIVDILYLTWSKAYYLDSSGQSQQAPVQLYRNSCIEQETTIASLVLIKSMLQSIDLRQSTKSILVSGVHFLCVLVVTRSLSKAYTMTSDKWGYDWIFQVEGGELRCRHPWCWYTKGCFISRGNWYSILCKISILMSVCFNSFKMEITASECSHWTA